jgi:hypothetical protein
MDIGIISSNAVKYRDFSRDVSNCVVELTPQGEFTIQTYTQNTFKQEDKSLQSMVWVVPLIERYQETFVKTADGRYSIDFETANGRPSQVFIYMERVGTDRMSVYSNHNPAIINLELQCMGASIQSIRDLDINQTYEATRRNAALRCNLIKLRQETGGILFGLEDLCSWKDFDVFGARDSFKGTFVVKEGGVESVDSTAITTVSAAEETLLFAQDRRITVLFIWDNHCLKGDAGNLRFWLKGYEYERRAEEKTSEPVDGPDYADIGDQYQAVMHEARYGPDDFSPQYPDYGDAGDRYQAGLHEARYGPDDYSPKYPDYGDAGDRYQAGLHEARYGPDDYSLKYPDYGDAGDRYQAGLHEARYGPDDYRRKIRAVPVKRRVAPAPKRRAAPAPKRGAAAPLETTRMEAPSTKYRSRAFKQNPLGAAPTMKWVKWKYPEYVDDIVRYSKKKRLSADDVLDLKYMRKKYPDRYDMVMRFMIKSGNIGLINKKHRQAR